MWQELLLFQYLLLHLDGFINEPIHLGILSGHSEVPLEDTELPGVFLGISFEM